ncbi:Uncharacterised protein [Bordetella pertussis]|nr:Uncharacterised protein [Bordetella pertussis]
MASTWATAPPWIVVLPVTATWSLRVPCGSTSTSKRDPLSRTRSPFTVSVPTELPGASVPPEATVTCEPAPEPTVPEPPRVAPACTSSEPPRTPPPWRSPTRSVPALTVACPVKLALSPVSSRLPAPCLWNRPVPLKAPA